VTPSSQSAAIGGSPAYFSATAVPGGDITATATWNILDSTNTNQNANFSISYVAGSGESFLPSSSAAVGTYTVNATYPGTTAVGKATLTVTAN
jgi:hypothetical protein